MARFFVEADAIIKAESGEPLSAFVGGTDYRHIKDVLRMQKGDELTVCDGSGWEYTGKIEGFSDGKARIIITGARPAGEPRISVSLIQGIAKGEKMDFIIQKTVELGVNEIVPVTTEFTVVRLENEKDREKKQERWQRISMEAAKQCKRGAVPCVLKPDSFGNALKKINKDDDTLCIMPYENERGLSLKKLLKSKAKDFSEGKIRKIAIFIGPEGGISAEEAKIAEDNGFCSVSLGPRILRTETAGMAAIAAIRYELED